VSMPLFLKVFLLPLWLIVLIIFLLWLSIKKPKSLWIVVPILFFVDLWINNLFTLDLTTFNYSFDWEKMVISNPGYLKLIERYWHEDLWLPFRIRNIFYSSWLLFFSWLNLVLKLWSPKFLILVLGYSGFFIFVLGIIEYFKNKKRIIWPLFWWLTVTWASALGILVDSKSALILALPALFFYMSLGVKGLNFRKLWIIWLILIVVDILIK